MLEPAKASKCDRTETMSEVDVLLELSVVK